MYHQDLEVQNLKCGGCANTILKGLNQVDGVENVSVDAENGSVHLDVSSTEVLEEVKQVLARKGYPVAGEANTLRQQMKSYVSCAIGRVS